MYLSSLGLKVRVAASFRSLDLGGSQLQLSASRLTLLALEIPTILSKKKFFFFATRACRFSGHLLLPLSASAAFRLILAVHSETAHSLFHLLPLSWFIEPKEGEKRALDRKSPVRPTVATLGKGARE